MSLVSEYYLIGAIFVALFVIYILVRSFVVEKLFKKKPLKSLKDIRWDEEDNNSPTAIKERVLQDMVQIKSWRMDDYTSDTGYTTYDMIKKDPNKNISIFLTDAENHYELGISEEDAKLLEKVLTDLAIKQGMKKVENQNPLENDS